jgi:hypothetical protein
VREVQKEVAAVVADSEAVAVQAAEAVKEEARAEAEG